MWTVGNDSVKVWDTTTWTWDLKLIFPDDSQIGPTAISADYRYLARGLEFATYLWDLDTSKLEAIIPSDSPSALAFSPDTRLLATATGIQWVNLWDMNSLPSEVNLSSSESHINGVSLSPNRQWAAWHKTQGGPILWNTTTGTQTHDLADEYSSRTSRVAFSPSSLVLATASDDSRVRLWSVERGNLLQAFELQLLDETAIDDFVWDASGLYVTYDDDSTETFNVDVGIDGGAGDVPEPQIEIVHKWVIDKGTRERLVLLPLNCQPLWEKGWKAQGRAVAVATQGSGILFMDFGIEELDTDSA